MSLQKKALMRSILEETVEFYSADTSRRATNGNYTNGGKDACVYFDPATGNMCAIGRYLFDPNVVENEEWVIEWVEADSFLKPEVRGLPLHFWDRLQNLHDTPKYWVDVESRNEYVASLLDWIDWWDGIA